MPRAGPRLSTESPGDRDELSAEVESLTTQVCVRDGDQHSKQGG